MQDENTNKYYDKWNGYYNISGQLTYIVGLYVFLYYEKC